MSGASGIVRMDAHDSNQAPELRPLHLSGISYLPSHSAHQPYSWRPSRYRDSLEA